MTHYGWPAKPASRGFYGGGVSYGGLRRLSTDWRIMYIINYPHMLATPLTLLICNIVARPLFASDSSSCSRSSSSSRSPLSVSSCTTGYSTLLLLLHQLTPCSITDTMWCLRVRHLFCLIAILEVCGKIFLRSRGRSLRVRGVSVPASYTVFICVATA